MALVQCGECKAEMSERAKQCPACGLRKPKRIWLWALLSVVGFLVLIDWAVRGMYRERAEEIQKLEIALQLCWSKQDAHEERKETEEAFATGRVCIQLHDELVALRGR